MNNLQKEKEEGFYNRITLFPNIEEDKFYERKYLQGDVNNPYSSRILAAALFTSSWLFMPIR